MSIPRRILSAIPVPAVHGRYSRHRRDDDVIKAPGIAAMMRRHPTAARRSASATVGAGLVLFVVASLTNVGAGAARSTAASTPAALSSTSYLAPVDINGPDLALPVTTPSARPKAQPKAAPAPVDNTLISSMTDSGIPAVALNAYRVAAARVDNDDPGCGIDWALLAGIGREESDHGQFAGAVLHADGVSTPRIIGIPLNGHGTALILDTDHGRLDGDTVYDHAIGPMQFIPSTWAIYGADANGDGVADVFNINDAALAAARYLCDAGGNLRTHAGQVSAILAYNESDQYLAQVLALADAYRRGIPVTGIPVGNTTGALAPVNSGGTPPPVNPGSPTANQSPTAAKTAPKPTPTPTKTSPGGSGNPGGGSGSPTGGSGGGSPSGTPTKSSPDPSPSPSSTNTCALPDLLNPGHCAIKKK
ncbi:MAG TPA: lytic murein transglycosylase [Jatrophihabitantaceae bacterium]